MKNLLFCEFEDKLGKIFFSTNPIALEKESVSWNKGFFGNTSYFPEVDDIPLVKNKESIKTKENGKYSFWNEDEKSATIFCKSCNQKIIVSLDDKSKPRK